MKTIAIDVMKNDKGIAPIVSAALKFCGEHLDYKFVLVGDRQQISRYTKETEKISIYDVLEVVNENDTILSASRKKSSMSVAITMVKTGRADAVLSAGPTTFYIGLTTIILGRMSGVKRPAYMCTSSTVIPGQNFLFVDIGANLVANSTQLVQWAQLANIFSQEMFHIIKPRIALLNIGTEDKKGFEFQQEAHNQLRKMTHLNYQGYIEPREILFGKIDIVVTDGYAGNIAIKAIEGCVWALLTVLKNTLKSKLSRRVTALLLRPAFRELKSNVDYRKMGAAWIIGAKGLALKAHGASDTASYSGALNQLYQALEGDIISKIQATIKWK